MTVTVSVDRKWCQKCGATGRVLKETMLMERRKPVVIYLNRHRRQHSIAGMFERAHYRLSAATEHIGSTEEDGHFESHLKKDTLYYRVVDDYEIELTHTDDVESSNSTVFLYICLGWTMLGKIWSFFGLNEIFTKWTKDLVIGQQRVYLHNEWIFWFFFPKKYVCMYSSLICVQQRLNSMKSLFQFFLCVKKHWSLWFVLGATKNFKRKFL